MAHRHRILLVTDPTYQARGRRYGDEDVLLSSRLREHFDLATCHPLDAQSLMHAFDLVMIRNSGPVMHYREAWQAFRTEAERQGTRIYNPLCGRGDMAGKRYLPALTEAGFPVIPTVQTPAHADRLPASALYAVKPVDGADSIGLEFVPRAQLHSHAAHGMLIQPCIDFVHEISFFFVDNTFHYALYAPERERRWDLVPYPATTADIEFAAAFVEWNTLPHGIQRIDACRTRDGRLLLVELEDLNPYLSLERISRDDRDGAIDAIIASLRGALARPRPQAHRTA